MSPTKSKNIQPKIKVEKIADNFISWIGSTQSLLTHSVLFLLFLLFGVLGVDGDKIMLVLTTIVSLEAIYLAIFIQMSINRNTESLVEVEKDIDEIQEDFEDIAEDVEEIQTGVGKIKSDVDEIQEDVEDIVEDVGEMQKVDKKFEKGDIADREILKTIKKSMIQLMREVDRVKNKIDKRPKAEKKNSVKVRVTGKGNKVKAKKAVKPKIVRKAVKKTLKKKKSR